ncbi:unnamed protein product [Staurois parvus]|uniref:Uncharacterized protein n=1 Tax=Staurois parvus TaxID=386267 RepID=A0ABN9CKT5_9NEOB|nr:unnamed protein product [Staurois parvus]
MYINNTDLFPVSSCILLCTDLHSRAVQSSVLTVESTCTQHTVKPQTANSLISPDVNHFLPS